MEQMYDILSFGSINELKEVNNLSDKFIFGQLDSINNRYELIALRDHDFNCGIVYYYNGIGSKIMFLNENIFIGFDNTVICVNYIQSQILLNTTVKSLFCDFLISETNNLVVVISELDISVIDDKGNIVWTIGFRDMVEDYKIDKNIVTIVCSGEEEVGFNIIDGSIVR